jgi:hypothetical protein
VDLSPVRVVCDWVQYRSNFRGVVDIRPILAAHGHDGDVNPSRIHLEPWLPTRASLIWEFNALYWKALDLWEQATGRRYEQALPGGQSDARNRDAVRDYSPHVLELARTAVADHEQHVSSFVLDATQPRTALSFLRYKIFLVYISNVYDNLPTDEVAQLGGAPTSSRPGLSDAGSGRRDRAVGIGPTR